MAQGWVKGRNPPFKTSLIDLVRMQENVIYVRGQTWEKLCDNTIRYLTYKTLYPWGKGPFGDENSVRMKDSVRTNMSRDHIAAQNCRVVWVRIFSPLALCYRLPVVIEGVLGGPDLHADQLKRYKLILQMYKLTTFLKDCRSYVR